MSDPVTNAEVEDVLSSIRRLVSEDKRPLHVAQRDQSSDRLVLTPALRVAEDHSYAEENENSEEDLAVTENGAVDQVISNHSDEAVEQAHQSRHVEAKGPNPGLRSDQSVPAANTASDVGFGSDVEFSNETAFDDPAHDYDADPYNFHEDDDGYEDAVQVLPASDGEAFGDGQNHSEISDPLIAEAEEHSDAPAQSQQHEEQASQEHNDPVHVDKTPADKTHADTPHDETTHDSGDTHSATGKADALRAKIEELEAAIGGIADQWEGGTENSGILAINSVDAMAWEDAAPEDAIADKLQSYDLDVGEPDSAVEEDLLLSDERDEHISDSRDSEMASKPAEDTAETEVKTAFAPVLDYGEDEQLIDEEALRDMVSEIVRAELQGALGERITRNVRKLVRREIHRALTAQELE
jgi:hypothetical protein